MALFDKVRSIISNLTGRSVDSISGDATPEQLSMDALDIEELKLTIEEEFDILFNDSEPITSVNDIVNYIAAAQA